MIQRNYSILELIKAFDFQVFYPKEKDSRNNANKWFIKTALQIYIHRYFYGYFYRFEFNEKFKAL